eukprot:9420742-Pyramimonas_sp.AAC.1
MFFNRINAWAGVDITSELSNILNLFIIMLSSKSLADKSRGQLQKVKGGTLEVEEGGRPRDSPPHLPTPVDNITEWPLAFFKPIVASSPG